MGTPKKIRVVIDTNLLISSLIFGGGAASKLRVLWQSSEVVPMLCKETVLELMRVLHYPKFKLTSEDREQILAELVPYAETLMLPSRWPALPTCRDPNDQVFLGLAAITKADALVTGDKDLLVLADEFQIPIVTLTEFLEILALSE
jgi:uncharacterized protein